MALDLMIIWVSELRIQMWPAKFFRPTDESTKGNQMKGSSRKFRTRKFVSRLVIPMVGKMFVKFASKISPCDVQSPRRVR